MAIWCRSFRGKHAREDAKTWGPEPIVATSRRPVLNNPRTEHRYRPPHASLDCSPDPLWSPHSRGGVPHTRAFLATIAWPTVARCFNRSLASIVVHFVVSIATSRFARIALVSPSNHSIDRVARNRAPFASFARSSLESLCATSRTSLASVASLLLVVVASTACHPRRRSMPATKARWPSQRPSHLFVPLRPSQPFLVDTVVAALASVAPLRPLATVPWRATRLPFNQLRFVVPRVLVQTCRLTSCAALRCTSYARLR